MKIMTLHEYFHKKKISNGKHTMQIVEAPIANFRMHANPYRTDL